MSREVNQWLDKMESFVNENKYIPVGEVEHLDKSLEASNVSKRLYLPTDITEYWSNEGKH